MAIDPRTMRINRRLDGFELRFWRAVWRGASRLSRPAELVAPRVLPTLQADADYAERAIEAREAELERWNRLLTAHEELARRFGPVTSEAGTSAESHREAETGVGDSGGEQPGRSGARVRRLGAGILAGVLGLAAAFAAYWLPGIHG
jgi:hypothetical protein